MTDARLEPSCKLQGTDPREGTWLRPIGVLHCDRKEAAGTPIQPRVAAGFLAELELYPEFAEGLADLEGFSRVWLIFLLHRTTYSGALSVTPYRDIVPRGIFATRAPSRPNPIGLSPVRLLGVEGHRLLLDEVDLLDGTPILDIKPYVPEYDSYPEERIGWIAQSPIAASTCRADGRFHE